MSINYDIWNKELLKYFFPPNNNNTVRLNIDFELLDTFFPHLGGHAGFIQAIKTGPEYLWDEVFLYQSAYQLFRTWKYTNSSDRPVGYKNLINNADDPPYLAYLCLLCLAWQVSSDDIAPNAYYPRLEKLFPNHGITAHNFEHWGVFWNSLKDWAENNNRGQMSLDTLGMRYVGIPRGQVIFTPAKVRSFSTFLGQIHVHRKDDSNSLVQKIIQHQSYSEIFLGKSLYKSIKNEYPKESLGKGAVEQLFDFLKAWNGRKKTRISGYTSKVQGKSTTTIKHCVDHLLRYNKSEDLWEVGYAIDNDEFAISENVYTEGFSLAHIYSRNGDYSFLKTNDQLHKKVDVDLSISLETEETRTPVNLFSSSSGIIFFQNFLSNKYIVESSQSEQDIGYFLCSENLAIRVGEWAKSNNLEQKINTVASDGSILFLLQGLNTLPDEAWQDYARFSGAQLEAVQQQARKIRLQQGTRTNRSGTYLDFDLPYIEILDSHLLIEGSLHCDGGTLKRTEIDSTENQAITNAIIYKIKADDNTDFICIKARFKDLAAVEEAYFHIDLPFENQAGVLLNHTGIDEFGRPVDLSTTAGIQGVSTTAIELPEAPKFDKNPAPDPLPSTLSNEDFMELENLARYRFLLALITESNFKKVSIRHAFELAQRLLESDHFNRRSFYRQLRYLRDLGYLEIGCDSKNRWTHIIPCPPSICLLPTMAGDYFCFTPSGGWQTNELLNLIEKSQEQGAILTITPVGAHNLIPPKITILAESINALEQILDTTLPACSNAQSIINFAGTLNEWAASLRKNPLTHYSGNRDGYYEPNIFRRKYTTDKRSGGTSWLEFYEDPETGVHQVFQLYRNFEFDPDRPELNEQFYAIIRDPSWARWWMHDREDVSPVYDPNDEDENVLIGYKTNEKSLWIPRYLDLPRILRRALVLCSSNPPTLCEAKQHYPLKRDARMCLVYGDVPLFIAELLAEKINAKLFTFGPATETANT